MRDFFRFASLAGLTQLVLVLNQLCLLPLQIRVWGSGSTASWYAAMAVASIVTVGDFGLRTAGHAEVVRSRNGSFGPADAASFLRIWTVIKLLMLSSTLAITAFDLASLALMRQPPALWRMLLIFSMSAETIVIIRAGYLDSASHYRAAEGSYLAFVAMRLLLAVVGITVFKVQEAGLAMIYLLSAGAALGIQGRIIRGRLPALRLPGQLRVSAVRQMLPTIGQTVSGPLASWAQMNLPVLVLTGIATPAAVTSYVALRAVFGLPRQINLQVARFASVQYVKLREGKNAALAEAAFAFVLITSALAGAVLGCALLIDDQRLFGLWLSHNGSALYLVAVVSFGVIACVSPYQIIVGLFIRLGRLGEVANRQFGFTAVTIACALVAVWTSNPALYLWLLAGAEAGMAISFMTSPILPRTARFHTTGWRALAAVVLSATFVAIIWQVQQRAGAFDQTRHISLHDILTGAGTLAGVVAVLATALAVLNADVLSTIFAGFRGARPVPPVSSG